MSLGTPGLPEGAVENIRLQVLYELSALLTGTFCMHLRYLYLQSNRRPAF